MSGAGGLVYRGGQVLPSLELARDWPAQPQPDPGMKVRAIWAALLARKKLIGLTLLALNLAGFAALHAIKPRYTAEATLLIGSRQEQVLDLKAVLAGLSGDSEAIESEMQLIRSRKVGQQVVGQLRLDEKPDFAPRPPSPSRLSAALAVATTLWNAGAARYAPILRLPDPQPAVAVPSRDPAATTVDNVLRHVGVAPKGRSRVVSVTFDSNDPATAAAGANAFANTYIANQLRQKQEATANARRWLDDRVAEMREQVINADGAVAAYRRRTGITPSRTGTLLNEQVSTLGEQQVQARIAQTNADARLRAMQGGRNLDALPEVQASATVQALKAQQAQLAAQVAELSRTLGSQHPKLLAARSALASVDSQLGIETGRIAAAIADESRTAKARDDALTANLTTLRQDVATSTDAQAELNALQHEADANRALYDRLLARSRETRVEGGLQQADAQVVSVAEPPEAPSFPNPAVILPIFFLASCIFTALLVFMLELRDTGFRSVEQVEAMLGITAVGTMPRLGRSDRSRRGLASFRADRNHTAFAEAVRSLHTSLMLSGSDHPPKVVLVASAVPGEGRSSVVLSLARLMSNCGKRVVVVDCDMRRPAMHGAFGASRGPGLTDVLAGKLPLVDALQPDKSSPAMLLAAGTDHSLPGFGLPPDLFASEPMRVVLEVLSQRFDLVLLDSSPLLAVSDTRNLCRLADRTLMVVRWESTPRFVVAAALRQVLEAGGRMAGVLLSVVDLKRYARHSTSGTYQRRIGLYLSE